MPYHWENRKGMADPRSTGLYAHVCWFLGAIFAIIGIVAAAIDADIGLGATNWFLLAIVAAVLGIPFFIGIAIAWFLKEKKG
jgi:uncharacterized membrane protein YdbT with pleckstrin-like domain